MRRFKIYCAAFLITNIVLVSSIIYAADKLIFIREVDFPDYSASKFIDDIDGDKRKELIFHYYPEENRSLNYIAIFDITTNKSILKAKSRNFGTETKVKIIGIAHNPDNKRRCLLVKVDDSLKWYSLEDSKFKIEKEQKIPIKGDIRAIITGSLTNKEIEDIVLRIVVRPDPNFDWITKEVVLSWDGVKYKKVWETEPSYKHQLTFIGDIDGDGVNELLIQTGSGPAPEGIEIFKWNRKSFILFYKNENIFTNYDTLHLVAGQFDASKISQFILSAMLIKPYGKYEMAMFKWNTNNKQLDKYLICTTCFPYPLLAGDFDFDGIDELFIFEGKKIKIYKLKVF